MPRTELTANGVMTDLVLLMRLRFTATEDRRWIIGSAIQIFCIYVRAVRPLAPPEKRRSNWLYPISLRSRCTAMRGIADLNPDRTRTGSIRAIDLLRHDALGAKPAGVREDDRAGLDDVFIE